MSFFFFFFFGKDELITWVEHVGRNCCCDSLLDKHPARGGLLVIDDRGSILLVLA